MKILIAEDDIHIRQGLEILLMGEGYRVVSADNGLDALTFYHESTPDFIILDIMMPKMDGYSVCREIRKENSVIPIFFLSAKDEEIDRVVGLELGADDYISKPFGSHELKARIRSVARRTIALQKKGEQKEVISLFPFGDLTVFPDELRAKRQEEIFDLSLRDIKILECLYQHKNKVVTRDMLFNFVWGYDYAPNSRTIDQHISKLRKLIERDSMNPALITTIHGQGYRYQQEE